MRKAFLTLLLLFSLTGIALAQEVNGSISTAGADCSVATRCVIWPALQNVASIGVYINVGTSGTFASEATVGNDVWFAVPEDAGGATTQTVDGFYSYTNRGYRAFRIRASAINGAAAVSITRGDGPLRSTVSDGAGALNVIVDSITAGNNNIGDVDVASVVPGSASTSLGKAEDGGHSSGDVGVLSLGVRKDGTAQIVNSDTEYAPLTTDAYGVLRANSDHPNRIRCTVTVSTATTLTAVGGSCAAPGAGLSIYITDILFATNAGAIAADSFNTLKYGTGGTCGTGTTVFWGAFTTAATQATVIQSLQQPIKIPANNEVCWINSTAGSKFLVLTGFIAP